MATATKRKPPPLTLAQQQTAEAARIASLSIDPQKAEIAAAVAAAEAARTARAKATEGATKAFGELTAGDAEQTRSAYADAAARVGQYGQGFTGTMREMQEQAAAAANASLRSLGLSGDGSVTSTAPANANVAHYVGAVLPGEGLAAQGARSVDLINARRGATGARLLDQFRLDDWKAGENVASIRAQIEKLESKRPGLILEALSDIRQQANAKRATDTQIGYLQLQQAKTKQDQAIAMTNLTGQLHIVAGKGDKATVVNTGKPAAGSDAIEAQTKAETSRANAATAAATARAATRQREASQARAERGRNERAEAARDAALEVAKLKRGQAATVAQKNTIISGANATATDVVNAYADKVWASIPNTHKKEKSEKAEDYNARIAAATAVYKKRLNANYGTMLAQVINRIGPNLKLIGYSPEMIRSVATRIVSTVATRSSADESPTGR